MTRPNSELAIHGGPRTIPEGMIRSWPPVSDVDRQWVMSALEAGVYTMGENYRKLEREFADWCGLEHALFVNSGTAALHMALVACGCGVGDQVIVPAYTWPSSATCCLHHNILPVFVDIDWETMNIDPALIEAAITDRTKAIIAVHLHGLPVDMDPILALARKHDLMVVEDCCQAHGATYKGRSVGTIGHCAASSTNQNKCLSSGEGGFFMTNNEALLRRGETLRYFGEHRPPEGDGDFHAYGMGWMYRSNEITAAHARAQLQRLDDYLAQQQVNAARLTAALANVPDLILPTAPDGFGHNYYNYTVRFDMAALGHEHDAADFRNRLVKALQAEGVQTGVWQGWPVPKMTVFQAKNGYGQGCPWSCPYAEEVDYTVARFPVAQRHCDWHTGMTTPLRAPNGPDVADAVAEAFRKVLSQAERV